MTLQSIPKRSAEAGALRWGAPELEVELTWGPDEPVHLAVIRLGSAEFPVHALPVVEVLTSDGGHVPASGRLVHTAIGADLRYAEHRETEDAGSRTLEIVQRAGDLEATLRLTATDAAKSLRSTVTVANRGERTIVLCAVASLAIGLPRTGAADPLFGWTLTRGLSDWLGEGRWSESPLRGARFPELAQHLTGHDPRGAFTAASTGTWSTGGELPTGILANGPLGFAIAWQIEHNGAWRWEVGEDTDGGYLALSGPTDVDSGWSQPLGSGDSFTTVPVGISIGSTPVDAVAGLTSHRRASRRAHPDNVAMPVVFNDYMNTLNGDPTTERLLPLIEAAGDVGAEIFCIDAGWYDDSGHWWDTVGEWTPSTRRFPAGLREVIDAIHARGMVAGLWLEPEVIGVRSPMAARLPEDAFLQRHGSRIVEHHRYHLDLRHPAAVAHLDEVVDRLVSEFGIGFLKFDYNVNPGPGTDVGTASVGAGLLEHNRAHLAWLDRLLDRHPSLVIENCASGAMRMDFAMLSRLAMQSTSDQQDFVKYPPIAASAPLSMLPEQAASWAYPQPEMDEEEAAFCLVTGLLGRYYVSGHLNRMDAAQRGVVADAIESAKGLRALVTTGAPHWPLGLPDWTGEWVALGLTNTAVDLVSVWRRGGDDRIELALPHLTGQHVEVSTVFPNHLPAWHTDWDAESGVLTVRATDARIAARTLRLTAGPMTAAPGTPTSPAE
ncbi:glycoside hydrolase family 36 protein [Microbacterium sp. B2969]|uniref:Glycoside hydrolase family 36 protein n=1 Tax=Microbacterium alkaliflavum TaxID=3248839 RepID=A0ABW7QCR2_9MICO